MTELMHYGTPRHSGRYPWGSGDQPFQSESHFLGYYRQLQGAGLNEKEIASNLGLSTTELRSYKSIASNEERAQNQAQAYKLMEKGYSKTAIATRMGVNESTVRSWLSSVENNRAEATKNVVDILARATDEKKYIDVGLGMEAQMGVSKTTFKNAITALQEQGYSVHYIKIDQLGTGKQTWMKVLSKGDVETSEVSRNREKISMVDDQYSEDGGRTWFHIRPPSSVDGSRVAVRYGDEGGTEYDGVIELRRGVNDISLGSARYAQVRIAVDGTHFLKGMAIYADDLPPGVDIRFNTNKERGGDIYDAMKPLKLDQPENPFGTSLRSVRGQRDYIDADGNKKLSPINIVNMEGDWQEWSNNLSSQVLSKQAPSVAKRQLDIFYGTRKDEFDAINSLTNPAVKRALLSEFADSLDTDSVDLNAAGLPRQSWNVILPSRTIKPTEIYAPNYKDGDRVALIRYPHGGTFEIAELTVNNRHPESKKILSTNARDAVVIHPSVAQKLSGADFDGDTVLVIPNKNGFLKSAPALKGLRNFNPKEAYPYFEGMKVMSEKSKGLYMGSVSNLITDMTVKGAPEEDIVRAVRHSMVVIDAPKHRLNFKQSYLDNGIASLKKKYQGDARSGAATLISLASSQVRVNKRAERYSIDPKTGRKIFEETGETYEKDGKTHLWKTISTKMAETDDAYSLSSGTRIEAVYAEHANKLKSLANEARKTLRSLGGITYSPSARKIFINEVEQLDSQLRTAEKNKPLERKAQLLAKFKLDQTLREHPELKDDKSKIKTLKGKILAEARSRVGSSKTKIFITDPQWKAIQAGAVSNSKLSRILTHADMERVRNLATPRQNNHILSGAKLARARALTNAGYSTAEIAEALGISASTVLENLSN